MPADIIICSDSDDLAQRAADLIVASARDAVAARGRFNIALAGGSTPEKAYKLITASDRSKKIDWQRFYVFFGDERYVPHTDDERSNYAMANRSLLTNVSVPAEHIYPIDTALPTIQASASAYSDLLASELGSPPVFDLVLLGMGDDGHTASLFPHAAALEVSSRWVADSPPGILPPPVDRVTLTFTAINAARQIAFFIGGEKKAEALRDVLEGDADPRARPSAGVKPGSGTLTFLIDQDAAKLLTKR